jgi:hypothetical protein
MAKILTRTARVAAAWLFGVCFASAAWAQTAPVAAPAPSSRLWIVAGGGFTATRGGCTDCEGGVYDKTGSFLVDAGVRVNRRADAAVELAWVPLQSRAGEPIRVTFLLAVGQFRPWENRGFFLKGGMGIAFVRNWIYEPNASNDVAPPYTTNAMGLTYGAGWVFKPARKVTLQFYGSQHVVALGDLTTSIASFENIVGNFWTVGAGIVIR